MLQITSLLSIPTLDPEGAFDISPDGQRVAFSWNQGGCWEIYELPLNTPGVPRQLTRGSGAKFTPRYASTGNRLAYVCDLDGGESFDVWICDLEDGTYTNLTAGIPGDLQPNFSWSPDGRETALISNLSGHFDTYRILADGGEPHPVLATPHPEWDLHWSPDGAWIAVIAEAGGQDYGIYLVPSRGGEPLRLSLNGEPLNAPQACWSPDGTRLAFSANPEGDYRIGIYSLASGAIEWIEAGQGDHSAPHWSPDGARLAFISAQGPQNWLSIWRDGGGVRTLSAGVGMHHAPRWSPDGTQIAFIYESPSQPPDLWSFDLLGGPPRQITNSLPAVFSSANFITPEHVRYPGMDGARVPALLFRSLESGPESPGLITIHGGPNWHLSFAWQPELQHYASRGWTILAPNYRGSTGYGRDWQLANRYDLGGVDTDDVVAGADYLVAEGLADPKRIAVTGRSHGGYLTMSCLTRYPDRWVGGSAVVPFLNWFTAHENSRPDLQHWDLENFGDPVKDRQRWYERSPYFFLERVRTEVQLICGAHDPRCPASESIAARDVLAGLGIPVDFALYEDEGHSFYKLTNRLDAEKRRAEFLSRVLEG